jgi:hypothetical protein
MVPAAMVAAAATAKMAFFIGGAPSLAIAILICLPRDPLSVGSANPYGERARLSRAGKRFGGMAAYNASDGRDR